MKHIEAVFTYIHNRSPAEKYCYIFSTPLLAMFSVFHTLFVLAFLAGCVLQRASFGTIPVQLVVLYDSSTGWTVFFVITALLVCAANIVLLIGAVWIVIISAIVAACVFIGLICGNSNSSCNCGESGQQRGRQQRRRRRRQDNV